MTTFEMPRLNMPPNPLKEFREMHQQSLEAQKALMERLDQLIALQTDQKDLLRALVQAATPRP